MGPICKADVAPRDYAQTRTLAAVNVRLRKRWDPPVRLCDVANGHYFSPLYFFIFFFSPLLYPCTPGSPHTPPPPANSSARVRRRRSTLALFHPRCRRVASEAAGRARAYSPLPPARLLAADVRERACSLARSRCRPCPRACSPHARSPARPAAARSPARRPAPDRQPARTPARRRCHPRAAFSPPLPLALLC